MEYLLTPDTIDEFVSTLLTYVKEKKVHIILWNGNLGSGKTTSIQHLGRMLQIKDVILSPTFVLMKTYPTLDDTFSFLTHIDAYRIEDGSLFKTLNLQSGLLDEKILFCVEWPERIPELAQYPHVSVQLTYADKPDERKASITYYD